MKKPLIVLVQPDDNSSRMDLAGLRPLLEPAGYQVEVCTFQRARQLLAAGRMSPDLLILERRLWGGNPLFSGKAMSDCPQIVLDEEQNILTAPSDKAGSRNVSVDIIALHGLIGASLVHHPRKNLRLAVQLPCCISFKGESVIGEMLSLGTGGAFMKPLCRNALPGDVIEVGIPLLGMKKELELPSRVLYRQEATPEHNYLQGMGVQFLPMNQETTLVLHDFLQRALLNDLHLHPLFSGPGNDSQNPVKRCSTDTGLSAPSRLHCKN